MIRLKINGRDHRLQTADGTRMLLSVLRDDLDLTGAKYGCGEGVCGACTVLVEGRAVASCQVSVASVQGKAVTTIEGLAREGKLHPMQEAFVQAGAFQCGFCTPGMILAAVAMRPGADVGTALENHICRCGSHPRIIAAVRLATEKRRG